MRPSRHPVAASILALLLLGALSTACAPRTAAPAGQPVADAEALAAELRRATVPAAPRQATFQWTLDEAGSRLRGRGVVRFVAPDRLRLDLFGPRGESYLSAALVDGEYRLPPAVAAERVPLPSPALLWAALGVLHPPHDALLQGARATDSTATLTYAASEGQTFRFTTQRSGATTRLERVERIGPSGVLESVGLDHTEPRSPSRAQYRNWTAYRDLVLEMESITDVPSFDPSVWSPGGAGR